MSFTDDYVEASEVKILQYFYNRGVKRLRKRRECPQRCFYLNRISWSYAMTLSVVNL